MIPLIEKIVRYLNQYSVGKEKVIEHLNREKHPKAQGDYYFDCLLMYTSEAWCLSLGGLAVPYHWNMEPGKKPPNVEACILIIGEPTTFLSEAVEIPECTYAPAGAIEDFQKFLMTR